MQHTMSIWPALELTTIRLVIYTIEFACRILLSKITNKVLESRRNLKIESKFRHKFDSRWPTLIIVSIFCVWCLTWGLIIYGLFTWFFTKFLRNFCEIFAKFLRNFYEIFAKFLPNFYNFFAKLLQIVKISQKTTWKVRLQQFCKKFVKISQNFRKSFAKIS